MRGIDEQRLAGWMAAEAIAVTPPVEVHPLSGDRSDGAFWVGDAAGRAWVLRRPPQRRATPTIEDLARAHRILAVLAGRGVPVPAPVAFCRDEAVASAPFSLAEFVDGHVLAGPGDAARLGPDGRRRAAESLVDALVALHAVDVDANGLGDLAPRQGHTARQLELWHHSVLAGHDGARRCLLLVHDLHDYLAARLPPEPRRPAIVHGDYRLDTAVFADDGQVRAVLHWEGATLGDPLADLADLMVYWPDPGAHDEPPGTSPFPTRHEIARRYADRSGLDLEHLDFFVGFAYWKMACGLEGVYARERVDGRVGPDQLDAVTHHVLGLAESARATLGGP